MALLGGYGSVLMGGSGEAKGKILDGDEEKMLADKKKAVEEEEKRRAKAAEESKGE